MKFKKLADGSGLRNAMVTDAGKTTVEPGTVTCLGIGPDADEKVDKITGSLKIV